MAFPEGMTATKLGMAPPGPLVEVGLLLPSAWAEALLEISERRQQTVGQVLRGFIDRALLDEQAATR